MHVNSVRYGSRVGITAVKGVRDKKVVKATTNNGDQTVGHESFANSATISMSMSEWTDRRFPIAGHDRKETVQPGLNEYQASWASNGLRSEMIAWGATAVPGREKEDYLDGLEALPRRSVAFTKTNPVDTMRMRLSQPHEGTQQSDSGSGDVPRDNFANDMYLKIR
ncbi:hypothetical protein NEOLEDRAFT_1148160 [Neolentinus lepideus HHB14362 ss-1]|uniref:Uncharacterized protein n=1 Tax=Neolentinus lepideus HHB14362 ss-1 TaxID=1314782 RepID=A0A165SJ34_9AGAM|nr:hypothetical protein NEOLEDRAFT_1148160 [Neolentinus lepideus HHB14362 ss-1]